MFYVRVVFSCASERLIMRQCVQLLCAERLSTLTHPLLLLLLSLLVERKHGGDFWNRARNRLRV